MSEYIVIEERGHCFERGSVVKLTKGSEAGRYGEFEGVSRNTGYRCSQMLFMNQVQTVQPVTPVQLELPFDLIEEATRTPRVTYLYVVEDEDGVYLKTFDRDHAREMKASMGGKKAGVIITAYAAVKEIR